MCGNCGLNKQAVPLFTSWS